MNSLVAEMFFLLCTSSLSPLGDANSKGQRLGFCESITMYCWLLLQRVLVLMHTTKGHIRAAQTGHQTDELALPTNAFFSNVIFYLFGKIGNCHCCFVILSDLIKL